MRVLSVGEDPAAVDFSKAPKGVDEAYIRERLAKAKADMEARGWEVRERMVAPEVVAALAVLRRHLDDGPFDVVLMGGGLKNPRPMTELFEALVNEVVRSAAGARLAFDNDPHEGAAAVARQAAG